jgi:hypothetical protein
LELLLHNVRALLLVVSNDTRFAGETTAKRQRCTAKEYQYRIAFDPATAVKGYVGELNDKLDVKVLPATSEPFHSQRFGSQELLTL